MKLLEKEIEHYLVTNIEKIGGKCWKLAPFGISGIPDRLVLLYPAVCAFAELKRTGKDARARQKYIHSILKELGFICEVLDSKEAIDLFVKKLTDERSNKLCS